MPVWEAMVTEYLYVEAEVHSVSVSYQYGSPVYPRTCTVVPEELRDRSFGSCLRGK